MIQSSHNLMLATAAELSWHVHNHGLIGSLEWKWEKTKCLQNFIYELLCVMVLWLGWAWSGMRKIVGVYCGNTVGSLNTLRPRQDGRRFADDTFKHIFLNENVRILIKISLKLVPKCPINNIPALVQIMDWRRSGDKPLSEPMMFTDAYIRHSASMS